MSQNDLIRSTSPYLLQHADNPVHWKVWDDAAFKRAREENKPILLSIGYAACHWCHVMAHESFEDIETANLMNELFINIKVDREVHPDVDHLYQKALSVLGQNGGWPLTMFLTPSGQPFWGGTYFPKQAQYGRPSFKDVLHTISDIFHNKQEDVVQNVLAISEAVEDMSNPKGDGTLRQQHILDLLNYVHANIDPVHGGLNGAPKFPQAVLFEFFWQANWLKKDKRVEELIHLSLEKMCLGGIYDHLGGGFARYSTDAEWLAPHFEKMLYDNALLVSLLTTVWRKHPSPLFKRSIFETIEWVLRDMMCEGPSGILLTSAYDADSEGEEGKFYVWDESEIDDILKEDAALFKKAYDVSANGNWEEKNILRRVTPFNNRKEEDLLDSLRHDLLAVRNNRIAPMRDDKVLCDWNAMMIKALCEAGSVFNQDHWIDQAKNIYKSLITTLTQNNQLHHSWCDHKLGPKAYLEDYANLCLAALALFEATGKTHYFDDCEKWVALLEERFWDKKDQGYFFAESKSVEGLEIRPKSVNDAATPSGNGLMAHVLCDLYHLTGKDLYNERFHQLITIFGSSNPNQIFSMPALCSALLRFENMESITIVGNSADNDFNILKNKAFHYPSPSRKILLGDGMDSSASVASLSGKTCKDGKASAYICQYGTCSDPVNHPDALEERLANLPGLKHSR